MINFFLFRDVFIFAIVNGVIFLNLCFGAFKFCMVPLVVYASIGDTLLAI